MATGASLDGRGGAAAPSARQFSLLDTVGIQARTIGLFVYREARIQFAESPLRALMGILEPGIFLFIMYMIREFLLRDVDFGTSLLLFLATGIVPFYLFLNLSSTATSSRRTARNFKDFAIVTPLDIIFARAFYEILTLSPVYIGLFWLIWFYGTPEGLPHAPDRVLGALVAIGFLGLGVGLFNAGIGAVFPAWRVIYGSFARVFMLTSGVHRVPEYLPEYYRQFMVWNPMMHAIEWFRSGFYHLYPTYSLDISYLLTWAGVTFLLGLSFERVTRELSVKTKKEKAS